MSIYQTILLAFDGSADGRQALAEGADLAALCNARVHLLAVLRLPASAGLMEGAYPESALQEDLTAVEAVLEEGVRALRARGLEVTGHCRAGEPVDEIAGLAAELRADLIVVGHRRRGRLARWWQGSLGSTLLDRTGASILVAMGSPPETRVSSDTTE